MRNIATLSFLYLSALAGGLSAQVDFTHEFIDNNAVSADAANTVTTGDFDQDGDIDVVGGAFLADVFSLYINDGSGTFTRSTIDDGPNANGARFVTAFDLDEDGDLDILATSSVANLSLWYENDGSGNFTANVLDNSALSDEAYAIDGGDLDDDGDMDVVIGANGGDSLAWLENDGDENFSLGAVLDNTTSISNGVRRVRIADLNDDGQPDIIVAGFVEGVYAWFENDGSGNFTSNIIDDSPNADGATAFEVGDLDEDGDMDIAAGSNNANQFLWYENDGDENFTANIIDNTTDFSIGPRGLTLSDIDQDGDLDIFTAAITGDAFAWYENDGSGNFTGQLISDNPDHANGAFAIVTADIDDDDVEDLVVAANISDAFSWFRTGGVLGVDQNDLAGLRVYPNPVEDLLNIQLPDNAGNTSYQLYNSLGTLLKEGSFEEPDNTLSLSDLPSGIYLLSVETENAVFTKRLLKY